MKNVTLQICSGPKEIADAASQSWFQVLRAPARPLYCAISGGRIAAVFFAALTELLRHQASLLQEVHFFWADERCVPPTDDQSNFAVAERLLFTPLLIPQSQVHPVCGTLSQEEAARRASAELRAVVGRDFREYPALDLVFLSMGEDGHVASLFPATASDLDQSGIYRPAMAPVKLPRNRVTLSYRMLQSACHLSVLISGADKKEALEASLDHQKTPLGRVLAGCRSAKVFTDIE